MDAIIVAAGMGKRLGGFVNDRPKCMLEIEGVSLFKRQTDIMTRNGISKINVVIGYKKEWFMDKRFKYFENTDYENNNILHSLFYAERAMDLGFFFSYSDIIYEGLIVKQMLDSGSDLAIAVDPHWVSSYEGRTQHPVEEAELVFSENGKTVSKIRKNDDFRNAFGEFLGIAYFSKQGARILKEVFHELKNYYSRNPDKSFHSAKSFRQAYMTDMFQELTNRGYPVDIITIAGRWAEIDTMEDLRIVNQMWKEKKKNINISAD